MPMIRLYDGWETIAFTDEKCRVSVFHFCTCQLNSDTRSAEGLPFLGGRILCGLCLRSLSSFESVARFPCRAILGLLACGIPSILLPPQYLIYLIAQADERLHAHD
jgi:hypothetical protein